MGEKILKFMTGKFWWVSFSEDASELKTLKNYKQNCDKNYPEKVFGGNIIPKQKDREAYIIFESETYYGDKPSFKLFLYDDNTTLGTIEYTTSIEGKKPKEYFKGSYKKKSQNEITIWGIWSSFKDYKEPYPILIELSRDK